MSKLSTMPPVGLVVIVVILSLFALSLIVLLITYARYSRLASLVGNLNKENDFIRFVVNEYADAYKRHRHHLQRRQDPPEREPFVRALSE